MELQAWYEEESAYDVRQRMAKRIEELPKKEFSSVRQVGANPPGVA
jgi:hypothetical protein